MCVFSSEKPNNTNKEVIASMMPVPSVAGIYAANYILQDIINAYNAKDKYSVDDIYDIIQCITTLQE